MIRRVHAPVLIALLAVAVHLPNLPAGKVPQEDAGVFIYAARMMLEGDGAPYRDVWDHKPPLIYGLDALGLALGGILGVWALQAVATAAAAVAGWRLLARAFGPRPALFGSAAWVLAIPRMMLEDGYFTNFVQAFAAPLQLAALWLYLDEERQGRRTWRTAALGASGGLAALLTPVIAPTWVAVVTILVLSRLRAGAARDALARLGIVAAATAATLSLAILALALAGVFADAWDQAVAFNVVYTRGVSLADRWSALTNGLRLLGSSGLLFVAAAGWAVAVGARSRYSRVSDARRLATFALLAFPLELAVASGSGRIHGYYFLSALPSAAVLAAVLAHEAEGLIARRRPRRAAAAATALVFAAILVMSVRPFLLMGRVAQSRDDGIVRPAVAYLGENAASGDEVVVWGSRASVLVLSGLRSPTRYVYQYAPLMTVGYDTGRHIDQFIADLERRSPRFILDASGDSPATPPLDASRIVAFDTHDPLFRSSPELLRIARFVGERYERAGAIAGNGWPVWRLRAR
jgi:hypothetical protein